MRFRSSRSAPRAKPRRPDARLSESYWGSHDSVGLGAVLGGKKLKSISIRGMGAFELTEEGFTRAAEVLGGLRSNGLDLPQILAKAGIHETAATTLTEKLHRLVACHGCPIPCNAFVMLDEDPSIRNETASPEPGIMLTNLMDAKVLEGGEPLTSLRQAMKEGRDPNAGASCLPVDPAIEALGLTLGVCPFFLHLLGRPLEEELTAILRESTFFPGIGVEDVRGFARKCAETLAEVS